MACKNSFYNFLKSPKGGKSTKVHSIMWGPFPHPHPTPHTRIRFLKEKIMFSTLMPLESKWADSDHSLNLHRHGSAHSEFTEGRTHGHTNYTLFKAVIKLMLYNYSRVIIPVDTDWSASAEIMLDLSPNVNLVLCCQITCSLCCWNMCSNDVAHSGCCST